MRATKLRSVLVFAAMALTLTACSMEASIQDIIDVAEVLKAPGQVHGITSGSGQKKKDLTSGQYTVSASVGIVGSTNTTNKSLYHQTSGGYKVFGSLQGAIVAE